MIPPIKAYPSHLLGHGGERSLNRVVLADVARQVALAIECAYEAVGGYVEMDADDGGVSTLPGVSPMSAARAWEDIAESVLGDTPTLYETPAAHAMYHARHAALNLAADWRLWGAGNPAQGPDLASWHALAAFEAAALARRAPKVQP